MDGPLTSALGVKVVLLIQQAPRLLADLASLKPYRALRYLRPQAAPRTAHKRQPVGGGLARWIRISNSHPSFCRVHNHSKKHGSLFHCNLQNPHNTAVKRSALTVARLPQRYAAARYIAPTAMFSAPIAMCIAAITGCRAFCCQYDPAIQTTPATIQSVPAIISFSFHPPQRFWVLCRHFVPFGWFAHCLTASIPALATSYACAVGSVMVCSLLDCGLHTIRPTTHPCVG